MAAQSEHSIPDNSPANTRPIELVTENDFHILRADEIDATSPSRFGDYKFMVRDPQNRQTEITVQISPQSVTEVTWRSRGRISNNSSYWICCAERHLAEYLWENDRCPPNAALSVEVLTLDDLNLAPRWGTT